MKPKVFFGIMAAAMCLFSCHSDEDPIPADNPEKQVVTSSVPTCISSTITDMEEREAIEKCFPVPASLEDAKIAFFSNTDLTGNAKAIDDFYDAGGLVVLVNPDKDAFAKYAASYEHPASMPQKIDANLFIYAYNQSCVYSILTLPDAEPSNNADAVSIDDLKAAGAYDESEDDEEWDNLKQEAAHAHDDTYFIERLDNFIEWIDRTFAENTESRANSTGYDPTVNISNSYRRFTTQMTVDLDNKILSTALSGDDYLRAYGDITIDYKIYPLFMYSCNSVTDAQGDYYIVEGSITAHNADVWHPCKNKHGATRNYIIGYYMKKMNVSYTLMDQANRPISGLSFYQNPQPQTVNASTNYTYSSSLGLTGSLSCTGKSTDEVDASLSLGFSASWSKSHSYSLQDVKTNLSTKDAKVIYDYIVQNINNSTDYDKSKDGNGYPDLCRTDMTCQNQWIWKIPYGTAGVEDNSDVSFILEVLVQPVYATWSWYRPAYDKKEQTFDLFSNMCYSQTITPPNRKRFGVLALKNASNYTVANIKVWHQDDAAGADPVYTIPSSYNVNEIAKAKLFEGTYRLEFDMINANNNKVVATYTYGNIVVKMGANEDDSTTEVSTVNATKK